MFTFSNYEQLYGFGSCLFLCLHEIDVELSWISCSINWGYFDYV